MKKLLIICMAAFAISCARDMTTDASGPVLVKINNAKITEKDVRDEVKMLPEEVMDMFQQEGGVDFLLNELAKKEMLYLEAEKKGYRGSKDFNERLAILKKRLMVELLLEDMVEKNATVSDEEVRQFYDDNKERFMAEAPGKGREAVMEFEVVEGAIRERLTLMKQKKAFEDYVASLQEKYTVEINRDAVQAAFGNAAPAPMLENSPAP